MPRVVVPAPPTWASGLFTVGVTGTNGKTTTTAWVAAALRSLSRPVARATTVGFFLDDQQLHGVRSVSTDPMVADRPLNRG